jgi:hypothetical protein
MSTLVVINTAFPLPAPDIEALIEGRMIVVLPRIFINPGRQFALYPTDTSVNGLPTEQYYRSNFLPTVERSLAELDAETVLIKAWARCEFCQVIDETETLDILSQLSVWTKQALLQTRAQRGNLFLAFLRVHRLPQPVEIPIQPSPRFFSLPQPLTVTDATPVLGDIFFEQRCRQLIEPKSSLHPELEVLQGAIAPLSDHNLAAKELDYETRTLLGWSGYKSTGSIPPTLVWIQTIAKVGHSSDRDQFESLVRKSLVELGFTNSNPNPKTSLNAEAMGEAEGLDFYCDAPYPVVGEFQARQPQNMPNSVSDQRLNLGYTHLGEAQFNDSVKIIFAADPLTPAAHKAAVKNNMNVIRPETWQRLVELKAQHQGSINLLELKPCLQQAPFGEEADAKVNQYIDKVQQDIKVRSRLVELVKNYLHNAGLRDTTVEAIHGLYTTSQPPHPLNLEEMHDILIELSSPLTGYLGRIRGKDWKSDRFYFLRELKLDRELA